MYVCDRCGFGHYHPLSYCMKCPGRLTRRDVPHPYRWETEQQLREHLRGQGINYIGDYPTVPEAEAKAVTIARYEEHAAERRVAAEQAERDGLPEQAEKLRRSERYWQDLINREQQ